jgi:hypothetical protein
MKLLVMQFSPPSHQFIPLRTKFHIHTKPQAKLSTCIIQFLFLDSRWEFYSCK